MVAPIHYTNNRFGDSPEYASVATEKTTERLTTCGVGRYSRVTNLDSN